MAINSILNQPAEFSLNAAYRPVIFQVEAIGTNSVSDPPVVYCDIYFNSVFYKTLSKSQYSSRLSSGATVWEFDIQDAGQEYLSRFLGTNGGTVLLSAGPLIVATMCKFRSSGITGGFIVPENLAPVQGTSDTVPVPGTGTGSDLFFIVNSTLQNEDDQDFATHLSDFKIGTWNDEFFPLTHRPDNYRVCRNDSDYFPVVHRNSGLGISKLKITYKRSSLSQFTEEADVFPIGGDGFYIPTGPKNLSSIFPFIDFTLVKEYYVQGITSTGTILFTTPVFTFSKCCEEDKVRIHFVNYLGAIDAINFELVTIEHETKSDSYQTPLRYPLDSTLHNTNRLNTKASDTYVVRSCDYNENEVAWLEELYDSPTCWIETDTAYTPVVISDGKTTRRKEEERYIYEVLVEFKLSHQRILIRN